MPQIKIGVDNESLQLETKMLCSIAIFSVPKNQNLQVSGFIQNILNIFDIEFFMASIF
jgi:hypothetical protein